MLVDKRPDRGIEAVKHDLDQAYSKLGDENGNNPTREQAHSVIIHEIQAESLNPNRDMITLVRLNLAKRLGVYAVSFFNKKSFYWNSQGLMRRNEGKSNEYIEAVRRSHACKATAIMLRR